MKYLKQDLLKRIRQEKEKFCKKKKEKEKEKNNKSIKESIPSNDAKSLIVIIDVSNLDLTITKYFYEYNDSKGRSYED